MFKDNDIFLYLTNKKIDLTTKEKFINKNNKKIIKYINILDSKKIVKYLFDNNLPISVKRIISTEINNYNIDNYLLKNEINSYLNENNINYDYILFKDYYPNILKKIIIEDIYSKDTLSIITDKTIDKSIKQLVIDVKATNKDLIKLLQEEIDKDLVNYIIDTKFNETEDIQTVLNNLNKVSDSIKEQIIIKKINSNNIAEVIYSCFYRPSFVEKIFTLKDTEIKKYVNNIKNKDLLNTITYYNVEKPLANKIIELRKKDVIKEVKKLNKYNISKLLINAKTEELMKIIIDYKKKTVLKSLAYMGDYKLLLVLNNSLIPLDLKEYLIEIRPFEIDKKIETVSLEDAKNYYLTDYNNLPKVIEKKIFLAIKNKFVKEIKSLDDNKLINDIIYKRYCDRLKKLMIEEGITKENIFLFLNKLEFQPSLAYETLALKKDIIEQYLKDLPNDKIFTLNNIRIPRMVKSLIINLNKEIIKNKLTTFDKQVLMDSLTNIDTIDEIKNIILEKFNIYDDDIVTSLQIINDKNSKVLIENYNSIKIFLNLLKIDFQTFIRYGSGSKNYKNWAIDIVNIINNKKVEQFLSVKNYFFNNYYNNNEQENTVYIIENFLELLKNFTLNNELCLNITKENKYLTKEDKLNISFLFKIETTLIDRPKTLQELPKFKLNLYDTYIKKINNKNVTLQELKDIFYSLIFFDEANLLKNIGGIETLKTLKKDNSNSSYICGLIDELMIYANIIEKVNMTNSKEGLIKVLKYIFYGDLERLTDIQNMFLEFSSKVVKLYELDSQFNLTSFDSIKDNSLVINKELSDKYGGIVYDFSDKNYILYAHTLSNKDNMDDLIKGISQGKTNFISVSPVSYMGQKYYYMRDEVILAFDKIPTGSFICSSVSNMGSNYHINSNSYEVEEIVRNQRGILETSAVLKNNSEALLYREGLKPCGLILPGSKTPDSLAMEYHKRYNLPFIITQEIGHAITSPKKIFNNKDNRIYQNDTKRKLQNILNMLDNNLILHKETNKYTGREIAIFTDCHSMYEPTIAVLEDIRKKEITEIYSLGDNIGFGPNPKEVFDLLEEYLVVSVAGNSEYYQTLGTEPFNYFYPLKKDSVLWTKEQLGNKRISKLKLYPSSIDIKIGNKKVALCHFANDVRWDFIDNSTWTYQDNFKKGIASKQFLNTNSKEAKELIEKNIINNYNDNKIKGFLSALNNPLFNGKQITSYDDIFQGHVHFEMNDKLDKTDIFTLRAVGMGFENKEDDCACYYVLKERKDGSFDIEKNLVGYNKNSLISNIYTSGAPEKAKVLSFVKGK